MSILMTFAKIVYLGECKCRGSVVDAKGKPRVSEKDEHFASFVNPTRGIKMDLENGNHNSCVVCKHFTVATRHDIRKLVWDSSRSEGVQSWQIKETLCERHLYDGFSAHSQTVGRPVTLDATEGGDLKLPLPTFFSEVTGNYIDPIRNKYGWKLKLRRFFKRSPP